MKIALLLMAAGRSQRFKSASAGIHKLLYPCDAKQTRMLSLTYQKASAVLPPEDICIITNQAELPVHQFAQTLGSPILNIQSQGMGESIAQAVSAYQDYDALMILHGDLPFIRSETIQTVHDALLHHAIARPTYRGRAGHPVGFQKHLFPQLMALQGDHGANALLKQSFVNYLPCDDQGTIQDIDTPQDLENY